jgi:cytochrome c551/c552
MRRIVAWLLLLVTSTLAAFGCGGGTGSDQTAGTPSSSSTTTPAPAVPETTPAAPLPATSRYDDGPRAGEAAVKATLAASGEKLFQTKGCVVCHGFGKKVTCPDLVGVSMRRTAQWMEQQILHPEVMVKEDRISAELRTHYALPMTNQGLKPDEAKAVIEFLKRKDREAGVKKPVS